MNEIIQFLIRHGYTLLFFWVFAEQIGLPIPAAPILLAAGALAGQGQLNLAIAVGLAVIASLLSDTLLVPARAAEGWLSLIPALPHLSESRLLRPPHIKHILPVWSPVAPGGQVHPRN